MFRQRVTSPKSGVIKTPRSWNDEIEQILDHSIKEFLKNVSELLVLLPKK